MQTTYLIIPGYGDSGPSHWQSLWLDDPRCRRVEQRDWLHPRCSEWVAQLEQAVAQSGPDTVLVAHSLGCPLVAHWAQQTRLSVRGALLVAPPDLDGPAAELDLQGFAPLPRATLPFPSLLIASDDDPYASVAYTRALADSWGSRWQSIGAAGHINGDSGLGEWPQGRALLDALLG